MQPKEEASGVLRFLDPSGGGWPLEAIFQSLIEGCSGVVLITDPDLRVITGNQKGLDLLEKGGGARGGSIPELLSHDQADRVREAARKAFASGCGASLDYLQHGTEDARCAAEWRVSPIMGPNREPLALLFRLNETGERSQPETELAALALNVSDRTWAGDELRHANETLRALLEATPLAIVAIDSEERISRWNAAAEKLFGWSKSEVLGRALPFELAAKPGERLRLQDEVPQRSEPVTIEAVRRKKGGAYAEVSISAAPVCSPDGSPCGWVAIITDISERRRLEDQLRQAQKMEAVGRLAGGIAHDFNNLLTVITGYDEMLLNTLAPDSRSRGHALEILQAAEKATALTKQLLVFSRRQVSHPALLDINPIVINMSNMVRRLIREDIELILALDPPLVTVRADPSQIEQIILNLAVNARDAMPHGGRITIETGLARAGRRVCADSLQRRAGPLCLHLSVTDTGMGMTPRKCRATSLEAVLHDEESRTRDRLGPRDHIRHRQTE